MELHQRICEWVNANREFIVDNLSQLVRFNTVNQVVTGTERDCQLYIVKLMKEMKLSVDTFSPEEVPGFRDHPAFYPGKDYTDRPNVVAVWHGKGGGKSILFSSHIDTAVVAPGWVRDPFSLEEPDGKLFGLGAFDMKGGLTASLMAVKCLQDLGAHPNGDVIIESVVDEEFGGANGTLAARLRGYHADAAIIPEPTNLEICPAHRGGALWRVIFYGTTGLSFSAETIVNPATAAGKFIAHLEEVEKQRAQAPGPEPWYSEGQPLPIVVTRVVAGDIQAPLCDVGPTTCEVDIWAECYPGVSEEALMDEILSGYRKKYPDDGVRMEFKKMIRFLPGSQVDPKFELVETLHSIAEDTLQAPVPIRGAPFACDAFMFNLFSQTPAVIFGPSGANAHAPDEYIEIEGLSHLIEVYARTIVEWCGVKA